MSGLGEVPPGATHQADFYGTTVFYRLTARLHYNTVIDHPVECWQQAARLALLGSWSVGRCRGWLFISTVTVVTNQRTFFSLV